SDERELWSNQSDDRNHQSELWSFRIAREVTRASGEVMRLSCGVIRESCEVTRESFGAFIFTFQRRVLGPITASVGVEVTLTPTIAREIRHVFPKADDVCGE